MLVPRRVGVDDLVSQRPLLGDPAAHAGPGRDVVDAYARLVDYLLEQVPAAAGSPSRQGVTRQVAYGWMPRPWSQAGHARPASRITNLALLVALLVAFASGVGAVAAGTVSGRWVAVAHGVVGVAVVLLVRGSR